MIIGVVALTISQDYKPNANPLFASPSNESTEHGLSTENLDIHANVIKDVTAHNKKNNKHKSDIQHAELYSHSKPLHKIDS